MTTYVEADRCIYEAALTKHRSAVIDWLKTTMPSPEPVVLSYYIDAARSQAITASEIFCALVRQIVIHYDDTNTIMSNDLRSKVLAILASTATMITLANLTVIIQQFLRLQPSCYVVVDGIDAMSEPEIVLFVNLLRQLWCTGPNSTSKGRLIVFCRETLGKRIRLDMIPASVVLQIKLEHIASDIHTYVEKKVDTKQQEFRVTDDNVLIDEIKSVLKSKSKKM